MNSFKQINNQYKYFDAIFKCYGSFLEIIKRTVIKIPTTIKKKNSLRLYTPENYHQILQTKNPY